MLAYGVPADATDEYIKIGELTTIESLKRFCRAVIEVFRQQYLRSPNAEDVARLLHIGQYTDRSGHPTIILEIVADYDLSIWHTYFGLPGSNNDINVLESSHLFANLAEGIAPPAHYIIQGKEYDTGYYQANGIYPKWSTLVHTIHDPHGPKKKLFAMKQEACRKDVERAFGVLKSRSAIVAGPTRFWSKSVIKDIMTACIILHNMIVEYERDLSAPVQEQFEVPNPEVERDQIDDDACFQQFLGRYRKIRNKEAHIALRDALIEHLWEKYTNSEN
ncbi:hypothetical protein AgCh_020306 [Apium graveolens]